MTVAIYAKQVPEHLVDILDKWRQKQIPTLNRQQAVIHVLNEWVNQHKQEFVKEGIITNEQVTSFVETQ
jgi:hypothetical protein